MSVEIPTFCESKYCVNDFFLGYFTVVSSGRKYCETCFVKLVYGKCKKGPSCLTFTIICDTARNFNTTSTATLGDEFLEHFFDVLETFEIVKFNDESLKLEYNEQNYLNEDLPVEQDSNIPDANIPDANLEIVYNFVCEFLIFIDLL